MRENNFLDNKVDSEARSGAKSALRVTKSHSVDFNCMAQSLELLKSEKS